MRTLGHDPYFDEVSRIAKREAATVSVSAAAFEEFAFLETTPDLNWMRLLGVCAVIKTISAHPSLWLQDFLTARRRSRAE
jgi:hypothetical protein